MWEVAMGPTILGLRGPAEGEKQKRKGKRMGPWDEEEGSALESKK